MSHHGIGVVFTTGELGRPEILILRDIEVYCPVCGKEQLKRFYGQTPLHTLTAPRLEALLRDAPEVFDGRCEQCDEPLDGTHARRWMLHYGFGGLRGLLHGFGDSTGQMRWLAAPERRIDVQLVPTWEPELDNPALQSERLSDAFAIGVFGRPLSAKAVARAQLARPLGPDPAPVAPGLWLVQATTEQGAASACAALDGPVSIELLGRDGRWRGGFFGAPEGWLAGVACPTTPVFGVASRGGLVDAVRRVVDTWPIPVGVQRIDATTIGLRLPDDVEADAPTIDELGVGAEAARSMLLPDEAAHLEVERLLHGLVAGGDDEGGTQSDDAGPEASVGRHEEPG